MSGPLGSSQWMYSSGFYPIEIDQSLMFDGTSYLSRTPSVAGNRKTWTFSTWFKRGGVSPSTSYTLFSGGTGTTANTGTNVRFQVQNDYLRLSTDNTSGGSLMSSADLRDVSAWYHVVLAFDTPQASASDRIKMYINGEQVTSFRATPSYPTQNRDLGVNNTELQQVGGSSIGTFEKFNGYLADTYLVDGTALDPTSFGEFKSGVWIPKAYTGSYNTNGFHLEYNDNANDSSGTGNNWTATNIVAGDYMLDSPTNNYATWNAVNKETGVALSNGNLTATMTADGHVTTGTMAASSGKYYFEWTRNNSGGNWSVGLAFLSATSGSVNSLPNNFGYDAATFGVYPDGSALYNGSNTNVGAQGTGSTRMLAIDIDAGKLWMGLNGTWYNSGNPAAGTNPTKSSFPTGAVIPVIGNSATSTGIVTTNFGQSGFTYTPPDDFLALSTANLPEPSISPLYGASPQDYFDSVIYTGSSSSQTIANTNAFQPDLVWAKSRSNALNHILVDSIRGGDLFLSSNTTTGDSTSVGLASFVSNGVTWTGGASGVNDTGITYVNWNWKASNAASVLNEAGSIPSQVSANTTAGFSIVSYTGTGVNATVGHGLSIAPEMVIVKNRDTTNNWMVYFSELNQAAYLDLPNSFDASRAVSSFQGTPPTTSVINIGTAASTNGGTNGLIAYCFHSVEGYSKLGRYTGNGSADGPFVYTGFRPAWVLIKRYDAAENWWLLDNKRNPYNQVDTALRPNDPAFDAVSPTKYAQDFLSNGIKLKTLDPDVNIINGTYIYMAFAENPFKYANAR
jgi:hypothetical protein